MKLTQQGIEFTKKAWLFKFWCVFKFM